MNKGFAKRAALAATVTVVLGASGVAQAGQFKAGDVVIYRVGDGSAALSNASTAVFLDEYSPAGTLVQSIALPTAAAGLNAPITASGTATSEGLLNRSSDGKYILATGYGVAPGTASVAGTTSAAVPRVIGLIDSTGAINSSTALSDVASGNNPRGAVSDNGTNLWITGASGGIRYATPGATTSTQLSTTVTNLRAVDIVESQLYVSTSSGSAVRLGTVGTGLPTTSGQTITNLAGFPTTGSPYQFVLADLSPAVAGVDTAYVADDTPGTIQKFSLVGGNWTPNGSVSLASARGLTGITAGTVETLYVTNGTTLSSIIDGSGYNAILAAVPTTLATAGANIAFRGVDIAPSGAVPEPTSLGLLSLGALSLMRRRLQRAG